jgi:hypothetical protein
MHTVFIPLRSGWRLFVRAAMLASIGTPSTPVGAEGFTPLAVPRKLTPDEEEAVTYVHLLSAVDHLDRGVTHSAIYHDSYLARLQAATPADRLDALRHYGRSIADYNLWVGLYGDTALPLVTH